MKKKSFKIRYISNYHNKNINKWKLIIDGKDVLVDDIEINCPYGIFVSNLGTQYHISGLADKIEINSILGSKKAILT